MRHINIERAVLIDGVHTEPQKLVVGKDIEAEMAAYLCRQGCATVADEEEVGKAGAPKSKTDAIADAMPRVGPIFT